MRHSGNHLFIFFSLALVLISCSSPQNIPGESLTQEQVAYISDLGLLDEDESIVVFNERYTFKTTGSFYTDKRVAGYWFGETADDKNVASVYYEDIKSMTLSDLSGSLRNASFILITKKNGRSLQVFIDGNSREVSQFFAGIQKYWMGR